MIVSNTYKLYVMSKIVDRIPGSTDVIINAVVSNQTVTLNSKKIEGCSVIHCTSIDRKYKVILRPKQIKANKDKGFILDDTAVGKLVNFPTREQIAGETGYTDEKGAEHVDETSGEFIQPFPNYYGSEEDRLALVSDIRDTAKTANKMSKALDFAMNMSEEQRAYLAANPHLAGLLK